MKKNVLFIIFCSFLLNAVAQTRLEKKKAKELADAEKLAKFKAKQEEGALVYLKQNIGLFNLNTNGWGIGYEHGNYKSYKKTQTWWLNLSEIKHPKQQKVEPTSPLFSNMVTGSSYVYGKLNNAYVLSGGVGQQRLLGDKAHKNGISVQAVYNAGISLAMLKPYYIDVYDTSINNLKEVKYTGSNEAEFLEPFYIYGKSSFKKGFNEMKFVPGVNARAGLRFDYGKFNDMAAAIEIGINGQWFTQGIPLMYGSKYKQLFVNGYVSIIVGRRK